MLNKNLKKKKLREYGMGPTWSKVKHGPNFGNAFPKGIIACKAPFLICLFDDIWWVPMLGQTF
jgi:hypothetical protein